MGFNTVRFEFNGRSYRIKYGKDGDNLDIFREYSDNQFYGKTIYGFGYKETLADYHRAVTMSEYEYMATGRQPCVIGTALFLYIATSEDGTIDINNARPLDPESDDFMLMQGFYEWYFNKDEIRFK